MKPIRKLVYISSPYRGDIQTNEQFARDACAHAIKEGCIPIAPHLLYPQILDDDNPAEREIGLSICLQLVERCDEFWSCGETLSEGMELEWDKAMELGKSIQQIPTSDILEPEVNCEPSHDLG